MRGFFKRGSSVVLILILLVITGSLASTEEIQFHKFRSEVKIPKTDIEIGLWEVTEHRIAVGKIGFKINNNFYYLEKRNPERYDEIDIFGNPTYAILNDLLIIGASGSPTGVGRSRWLFLLKYSGNKIEIIDALNGAGVEFVEDYSNIPDKTVKVKELNILEDANHDNKATFKIYTMMYPCGFNSGFYIYVDASKDGLRVNLNPEIYRDLFERSKKESKKQGRCSYFIYSYITGYLDRNKIETVLKKEDMENSRGIMELIDNLSKLNDALHPKEQIILKKIKKEGGK